MDIKHYVVKRPNTLPPTNHDQWIKGWHGCYRLADCWSTDSRQRLAREETRLHNDGLLGDREFEVDCFLSILEDTKSSDLTLIEAGAGWGEWCLALAGIVTNKLINTTVEHYNCIAIEAEPMHYWWTSKHFRAYCIPGQAIWAAVSDKVGECRFNKSLHPSSEYGNTMSFRQSNKLYGLFNLITGFTVKVPVITIDSLNLPQHCFLHMDVQGAEYNVIRGAKHNLTNNNIDYMMIGTHRRKYNDMLASLLTSKYELVVNIYPNSTSNVDGLHPVACQDGIQVYKRRFNGESS